jgi:uncharacterized protein
VESTNTWAVVTGACSGIGLAFAHELARRGYSLVLVSNREPELHAAARKLSAEYPVSTHAIAMDLGRAEAASALYEEVRRRDLEVEVLISNAGMLFFGEVADADPVQANTMLQLHVVTPSLLAHYFARDMRVRRRGHILLVSSASSWNDFPGIAYYGSSKRYLRHFAEALREELRPWGVSVTCLAPGAVATGLYGCDAGPSKVAARLGLVKDPAHVARIGTRGMLRRRAVVLPGSSAKLMAFGAAVTPRWLIRLARTHTSFLPRPQD